MVGRGTKTGRRYDLKTLRAALGKTQSEVAETATLKVKRIILTRYQLAAILHNTYRMAQKTKAKPPKYPNGVWNPELVWLDTEVLMFKYAKRSDQQVFLNMAKLMMRSAPLWAKSLTRDQLMPA